MADLKQLEETIAVFGANVSRWPDAQVEALRPLCNSADGQALLAGERAFEVVLDHAPSSCSDTPVSLMAGIMDATINAPQDEPSVFVARKTGWIAAGLMAASLVIGVFAGMNGLGFGVDNGTLVFGTGTQIALNEDADDPVLSDLTFSSGFDLEDDVL